MRLNDKEEPFTPICTTENIPLFVMCLKNELSTEHKAKLDSHLRDCDDCKVNFAYVKEILDSKHTISLDEKTLLLKYLTDPLFYYFANNIRKKILMDVKELLQEASIEVKKMNGSGIDTSESKPSRALTKLHQVPYPYFVLTLSIMLFFSLGISVILVLSSKYPTLRSYLPFSNSASPVVEERLPNNLDFTLPTMSLPNRAETNRYQEFDAAIDEFLTTQDRQYLIKAETIAKDIQLFYEDNYGVDLVGYYKTVPSLAMENLLVCHKKLSNLFEQTKVDNYQERLLESQKLKKEFLALGNTLEASKVDTLISKISIQLRDFKTATLLIEQGTKFAEKNNYIFLQTHFLLWQAKQLCQAPDFFEAKKVLLQVIDLATKLNLNKVVNSAGTSLAMIYYRDNNNEEAFYLTKKLLGNLTNYENEQAISFLQIAGLTSFNLGYYQIADYYLKEAIKNSQQINSPPLIARSYAFLGLTFSEQKKFAEAENNYFLAQQQLNYIKNNIVQKEVLSIIIGYKAKNTLLKQDYQQALTLYEQKLSLIKEINLGSNLELTQVNEAMAIAYLALGEKAKAQEHNTIAKHHKTLATSKNETTNCLLSLVPINCNYKNY